VSADELPINQQIRVRVSAVEQLPIPERRIAAFHLDSPRAGEEYRGSGFELNGWVIGREAPVQAVRVVRNGQPDPPVPLDVQRPDVAADYPSFLHATRSGFSVWAPLDGEDDAPRVTLEAVMEDGEPIALARISAASSIAIVDAISPCRFVTAPDFVIIGAQRGGTTSLHAYLATHPRVDAPNSKELHFLTDRFQRGREWYLGQFPEAIPCDHLTGEATPYALFHPQAPGRLRTIAPQAKIIVLLRNPVERAFSHYEMERSRGDEALDFASAIAAEAERLGGEDERLTRDPLIVSWAHKHQSYLARGDYAPQLLRWFDVFPRKQMLIMRSEDLYERTAESFAQAAAFLGIDSGAEVSFGVHNRGSGTVLDPGMRELLDEHFRPLNTDLARLLGWDPSWQ
jgi:hypothetical protein